MTSWLGKDKKMLFCLFKFFLYCSYNLFLYIKFKCSLLAYQIAFPFQHEHPYISAQVNNGSEPYDHDSDGTHSQVAGCTVSLISFVSFGQYNETVVFLDY